MKNFKLFMLLLVMVLGVTSCSSGLEKRSEDFLKNSLNDPSSYERISVKITDTTVKSEIIRNILSRYNKEYIETRIKDAENDLLELEELKKRYDGFDDTGFLKSFNDERLAAALKDKKYYDSCMLVLNHLKENPIEDSIMSININIKYRAKNAMGALIKGNSIIKYLPDEDEFFIYSNK